MHIRNRWDGKCFFGLAPQSNARPEQIHPHFLIIWACIELDKVGGTFLDGSVMVKIFEFIEVNPLHLSVFFLLYLKFS